MPNKYPVPGFGLNNIYSQKNTYVNTTQMVQDLTVSATLIYKSSPDFVYLQCILTHDSYANQDSTRKCVYETLCPQPYAYFTITRR